MLKSKTVNSIVLITAALLFLAAWGKLMWSAQNNAPPAQQFEFVHPISKTPENFECRNETVYYQNSLWRYPCIYKKNPLERYSGDTLDFAQIDLNSRTVRRVWQMPPVKGQDFKDRKGEENALESEFNIFAFAPNPQNRDEVAVGFAATFRQHYETQPQKMYFFRLRPDGSTAAVGKELTLDHGLVTGVGWNGEHLEVVSRYGKGVRVDSAAVGADWTTRRIEIKGCPENRLCRLEAAYRKTDKWNFVYSSVPRILESTENVAVEILEAAENDVPVRKAVLPLADSLFGRFDDDDLKTFTDENGRQVILYRERYYYLDPTKNGFYWWENAFDASIGNLVGHKFLRFNKPLFYKENDEWRVLEPPFKFDHDNEKHTHSKGDVLGYYHDGENLRWLPTWNYDNGKYLFHRNRWVFTETNDNAQLVVKNSPDETDEKPLLGRRRGHWVRDGNDATATPAENGALILFNRFNDFARADENLNRTDFVSLPERFERMIYGNFKTLGGEDYWADAYRNQFYTLKIIAAPLILLGFPLLLLLGISGFNVKNHRPANNAPKPSFWTSATARNYSLTYIFIVAALGYFFWNITAYF